MAREYFGKKEETKRAQDALRKAGFKDFSVVHGTGTASNWIEITLYGNYSHDDANRAQWEVQKAVGREHLRDDPMTDYFEVNILCQIAEKRPAPRGPAKFSTKGQVVLESDQSKTYQNGANDRMIRIKAGDYTYIFEHITFPRNPRGHIVMSRIDPQYPNHISRGSRKIQWYPDRLIAHLGQKQPELARLLSQLIGAAAQISQSELEAAAKRDLEAAARFLSGSGKPTGRPVPFHFCRNCGDPVRPDVFYCQRCRAAYLGLG